MGPVADELPAALAEEAIHNRFRLPQTVAAAEEDMTTNIGIVTHCHQISFIIVIKNDLVFASRSFI